MISEASSSSRVRNIPRSIWALGFVSMFMDISSEMIHALLPIYLVTVLGASMITVGFIEGIAEAATMIVKIFSGALGDWLGRRKALAAFGYGLAAFTKPIFPLAPTVSWLMAARFIDRVGKGIRGAPRDALVADLSPADLRGASFGLRQSLDTIGAFIGPLAAIGLMVLTGNDFTTVFWIAVIPAFLSFGLMVFGVEEPARTARPPDNGLQLSDAKRLTGAFWAIVTVGAILTLARFSEAFLVLRAQNVGVPIALVPVVLVVMNVAYAFAAYPVGVLSDRLGRDKLLALGIVFLIIADLVLAFGATIPFLMFGVVIWGLHMGFTQGLLPTLVADSAPVELRATAFGVFNFASGIAMLVASVIAGALWDNFGPTATFAVGAVVTAAALASLVAVRARRRSHVNDEGTGW
jgi:MFS family permease